MLMVTNVDFFKLFVQRWDGLPLLCCDSQQHNLISPQGQQHWRVWSGDVLLSGHGDPGQDHFSWPQTWWHQCSSDWGEQGGVYWVQYNHFISDLSLSFWVDHILKLTKYLICCLQSDGRVEVLPRGGRSDQSFPGRLQRGGSTSVAPVLWWKGAWGEQQAWFCWCSKCSSLFSDPCWMCLFSSQ